MMRALWTAGSGMTAQQFNVDVISNNLANANTTGYKKQRTEFKELFYETMERASIVGEKGKPVNIQVGHGVTYGATARNFSMGSYEQTENPLDFAIEGDGFFTALGPNGNVIYTRDGSFKFSVTEEGNKLTTADGYPVIDQEGNQIIMNVDASRLVVSVDGEISYVDSTGVTVSLGQKIGLVKFPNRNGLESIGGNFFVQTNASGAPQPDAEYGIRSNIRQRFLEASNVQVVEEMVKLIVAQRAYELNSKAIQASDEMLGMANSLRR